MARVALLYAAAVVYAIIRYAAFAPQNLPQLPVFVANKGISMAAAFCFAFAFWQQWRRQIRGQIKGNEPAVWFRAGVFGVIMHIPMSLAILRPAYFKEFFSGERLSFNGEAIFLFGALAAAGVYLLTRSQWTSVQRWRLSLAAMGALFAHALCMGIARGLNINRSHAYLPPMWLLSLIGVALGIGYLLMARPRQAAETPHDAVKDGTWYPPRR